MTLNILAIGRVYPTPTNTYKSLHLHSARKKTLNFTTSQFPLKNGGLLFCKVYCLAPILHHGYQIMSINTAIHLAEKKSTNQPPFLEANYSGILIYVVKEVLQNGGCTHTDLLKI